MDQMIFYAMMFLCFIAYIGGVVTAVFIMCLLFGAREVETACKNCIRISNDYLEQMKARRAAEGRR